MHLYDVYSLDWRNLSLTAFCDKLEWIWNATVTDDDIVIVAGDIGKCCQKTVDALTQLKGHKILVVGNHDLEWGLELFECPAFEAFYSSISFCDAIVEHIPRDDVTDKYFIHGHQHEYESPNMWNQLKRYIDNPLRLNCAADMTGCKPMSLYELITCKEIFIDKVKQGGLTNGRN